MANNKVQLSNGTVVIDLSSDTVTSASHIKSGLVGHLADGTTATGTLIEKDVKSVTYNLTSGVTASISTSEVVTGQGFSVKLKAPTGYSLSGVTVTMGGNDITSQVFTPDAEGGGDGGGSVVVTEEANETGITCVITTGSEPTPPSPSETWETLFDNNINFENGGTWITELGSIYPSSGDTWRVTINGNTYQCETSVVMNQWGTSENYVGNPAVAGSTDDGQDVPFAFINRGYGAWNGYITNASGNYAIKIERLVTS